VPSNEGVRGRGLNYDKLTQTYTLASLIVLQSRKKFVSTFNVTVQLVREG